MDVQNTCRLNEKLQINLPHGYFTSGLKQLRPWKNILFIISSCNRCRFSKSLIAPIDNFLNAPTSMKLPDFGVL